MHKPRSSSIVQHALEVVRLSRVVVEAVQRRDRDLASQLRRALSSVALNLSEGFGNCGGHARVRFETALGSLKEARTGIQVAIAWGYVSESGCSEVLECIDSLGGRVFGLARKR